MHQYYFSLFRQYTTKPKRLKTVGLKTVECTLKIWQLFLANQSDPIEQGYAATDVSKTGFRGIQRGQLHWTTLFLYKLLLKGVREHIKMF